MSETHDEDNFTEEEEEESEEDEVDHLQRYLEMQSYGGRASSEETPDNEQNASESRNSFGALSAEGQATSATVRRGATPSNTRPS